MNLEKLHAINYAKLDLDHWIARSVHDGPLTGYKGDQKNYEAVAAFALSSMNREVGSARFGCWKADHPEFETFDEGCQGKALALLSCLYHFVPELRNKRFTPDGPSVNSAAWDALRVVYLHQFIQPGGLPFPGRNTQAGIPGFLPQSPGWKEGEASFPQIAGLRTMNDGCLMTTIEGMLVFLQIFGDHSGHIPARIKLAGHGVREAQNRNEGWMPEQMHSQGEPAWGRGHEPAAWSPRSTAYALMIYVMLHALTEEKEWLAWAWETERLLVPFAQSSLTPKPGEETYFEHFLEPRTLRPIWGREGDPYQTTYNRSEAKWPSSVFGSLEVMTGRMIRRYREYVG